MLRSLALYALLALATVCMAQPTGDIAPVGAPDGKVTVADALITLRYALGLNGPVTADVLDLIDVAPFLDPACNWPVRDNKISVADALTVLRVALNLSQIAAADSCGRAPVMTSPATVTITENTRYLVTPTARNDDGPVTGITYQIGGADAALVAFVGGDLQFVSAPDFEAPACSQGNTCVVSVTPSDGVDTGAAQTLTVQVVDGNENAPVITSAATATVAENATAVMALTASDADATGEVTVFSLGGADLALFQIDGSTLSFIAAPDFENPACSQGNVCVVEITPSDGVNTGTAQTLTINVIDANDIAPIIVSSATANVAENATAVLNLSASDVDTTGEATVYNLGGADAALFRLSGNALGFIAAPDFEAPACSQGNTCVVGITPSDGVNIGPMQTLTVTITDLNDTGPTMTSAAAAAVPENTTTVLALSASDADTTGEVALFSLGGADGALFQLNGSALSFLAAPDFESPACSQGQTCVVTITPSDGVNAGAAQTLTVRVTDVNDNAPAMTSPATVGIPENTTAVLNLSASDADTTGEATAYSLAGADMALFQLAGSTLSFIVAPDFEAPGCSQGNTCVVELTPGDGVNTGTAQTLTIHVADANDHAPAVTSPATVSVPEGASAVLTLSASDTDTTGEATIYGLGGADMALFQINNSALSFVAAPDFEAPACSQGNTCVVEITPGDGVNTGTPQTLTVTVTDVNDTAPVVTSAATATVQENTTAVLTLSASDADTTGEVALFSLGGADGALFQLNGSDLSFISAPDFDLPACSQGNTCVVTITPNDGVNTGLAQTLTVQITDVDDTGPVITSAATVNVPEGTTAVVTLSASDVDTAGEITAFSLGGADAAWFQLSGKVISLLGAPDFETPTCSQGNTCVLAVSASDGTNTGPVQALTVQITDVNDNPPAITSAASVTLAENTIVASVLTVSDADTTGDTIMFTLGGADAARMTVNGSALSFLAAPDFESPACSQGQTCVVTITPNDGVNTGPVHTLTITIVDANDIAPVITSGNTANVQENSTAVLTLSATDGDTTGEATVFILGGDDGVRFQVSGNALRFVTPPDFENATCSLGNTCILTVTPSDGVNLGVVQTVTIFVTDLPRVAFQFDEVRVTELDGSLTVQVELQKFVNTAAVSFVTTAGTATENVDYNAAAGTLNFTGGATFATTTLTIHADIVQEDDETFVVALLNPVNAELGSPAQMTVTIADSTPRQYDLNDTGITGCGDYPGFGGTHDVGLDCTAVGATATVDGVDGSGDAVPAGQDAHFGRDVTANDGSDGRVGFSFVKLGVDGTALADQTQDYATQPWACVEDAITGLIWEAKTTDGGLRDGNNTYTWYNPDNAVNGGGTGIQNGGTCSGACDSDAYVGAVNALGLCGFTDWRVPARDELHSLVDYGTALVGPTIDAGYFPNTRAGGYWAASPDAGSTVNAWATDFSYGSGLVFGKGTGLSLRLVRGGQ